MGNTVYDIARVAGVSRTTVMRALSNKPDISPVTKARIKRIAAELKYRPNYIARNLSLGKSRLIGIVGDPVVFRSFHHIISFAQRSFHKSGYGVLYYSGVDAGIDNQIGCIEHMVQNRVEGVLAVPGPSIPGADPYLELIDSGAKLVVIDGKIEGLDVPQVVPDNYKAGRLGIEHLASLGHKKVVYLGIPPTYFVGRERLRGVTDAMNEAGIPVDDHSIVETEYGEEDAEKKMAQILKRSVRPTAIFCRHDYVARGAMRAILDAGLSIPRDISLVGCGDLADNDILRVPLTSIRFPGEETITIGIAMLAKLLRDKKVKPDTTVLDVEFVLRESTAPPKKS